MQLDHVEAVATQANKMEGGALSGAREDAYGSSGKEIHDMNSMKKLDDSSKSVLPDVKIEGETSETGKESLDKNGKPEGKEAGGILDKFKDGLRESGEFDVKDKDANSDMQKPRSNGELNDLEKEMQEVNPSEGESSDDPNHCYPEEEHHSNEAETVEEGQVETKDGDVISNGDAKTYPNPSEGDAQGGGGVTDLSPSQPQERSRESNENEIESREHNGAANNEREQENRLQDSGKGTTIEKKK